MMVGSHSLAHQRPLPSQLAIYPSYVKLSIDADHDDDDDGDDDDDYVMIREKEKERPLQYFSFQRRYRPSTVGITTEERKGFWSQNKSDQM